MGNVSWFSAVAEGGEKYLQEARKHKSTFARRFSNVSPRMLHSTALYEKIAELFPKDPGLIGDDWSTLHKDIRFIML